MQIGVIAIRFRQRNVAMKIVNFILKEDDPKEGIEPLPRDKRY